MAEPARRSDWLWLLFAVAVIVGTGVGVRLPWPADEPRFALIARDMVATGDWLFPRIGGDLYGDKPPFFFWILSLGYWLTGSLRASFLVPAFLASYAVVALIYDLGRRLHGREAGLCAALVIPFTVQFVQTMRGAQIDPVLCGLTTLSLYALLRHLLLGPAWGWYFIGGLAAGLGVITKGVGFLPLLVLIPYAFFRARGFNGLPKFQGGARWGLVAVGFFAGVFVWFLPMVITVALRDDPSLTAYRNEILFQQTVERYASAWHHVKPWYYFIVEVIPGLWLPLSLLLFWLVPKWTGALKERDARVWLPLTWVLLATLFFSLSTGKRGVYLLPALPAAALAAAPFLPELFRRKGVQRASLVLAAIFLVIGLAVLIAALTGNARLDVAIAGELGGAHFTFPIAAFVAIGAIALIVSAIRWPLLAWPSVVASLAIVVSYTVIPNIDGERSARTFMSEVLAKVPKSAELGLAAYKEQFLLYLDRPIVNFGHARWREGAKEADDAAAWLNASPGRMLLIPATTLEPCFRGTLSQKAGVSSGDDWLLVTGKADDTCASRGDRSRALLYRPPAPPAG